MLERVNQYEGEPLTHFSLVNAGYSPYSAVLEPRSVNPNLEKVVKGIRVPEARPEMVEPDSFEKMFMVYRRDGK